MRDYLNVLRGLLAGDTVTYDGPALKIQRAGIGKDFQPVPVYLAALGPQMLRLAGAAADGACLNWASPDQIAFSREEIAKGAIAAGRDPGDVLVSMYIRICVDEDVDAARKALATQVLGYSMVRPGGDPTLAYRGHFGRMGFEEELRELERRRDAGASIEELADAASNEMLLRVGYFGKPEGAAAAYAKLSEGLDETIVRVITARPGMEAVIETMEALTPALIREN
jgi:5,10-methylenetetrahydromethanopterin reductase